ncbi:MAG: amino acid permease, partial [Candidatus Acidiferrales bacterium]
MGSQLWRTKSIDQLIAGTDEPGRRLKKVLGPWALVALGIGAVIGTGVWTLSGTAALGVQLEVPSVWRAPVLDLLLHGADATGIHGRPGAGPAVALSYILVALACGFAALCYAELASSVPVAGSAYTYSYATLGELVAWIIGWDLILEYAVSNSAVAVGFSGHLNELLQIFGLHLPPELSRPIINDAGQLTGAWFNLPAFLVVMILTLLLVQGIRETAGANNVMVIIKVAAILLFIVGAASYINVDNLQPFMPNGPQSVLTGAALVFFAYIGFDSVSTAAEECRNPQRDMPFGIIGTLIVCMILYVGV